MSRERRGASGLRWLLVGLGVAGLLGGAVASRSRAARRALDEARARADAEREEVERVDAGRPALLEPSESGDADEVMDAFVAAIDAVPARERSVVETGAPSTTDAERDAVIAAHPEPLRLLAPLPYVARRAREPASEDSLVDARFRSRLRSLRWLVAADEAAQRRRDRPDLLRLSLATFVYGHDVAAGRLIDAIVGLSIEDVARENVAYALREGLVTADGARSLRRVLEALDARRIPLRTRLAVDRADLRRRWSDPARGPEDLDDVSPLELAWRAWGSRSAYLADALHEYESALEAIAPEVERWDGAVPPTANASWSDRADRAPVRRVLAAYGALARRLRAARAWSAVLRTALAVAEQASRTRSLPASLDAIASDVPRDPWSGDAVRYERGRVSSVGSPWSEPSERPIEVTVAVPR